MPFAEDEDVIHTRAADRADEPLGERPPARITAAPAPALASGDATQAVALVLIVIAPGAPVLVGMTFVYGFCLGRDRARRGPGSAAPRGRAARA